MSTTNLILGLHVDVKSDELKTMLLGRLKYHEDKTSFYEKQLKEMQKIDKALSEEAQEFSKVSTASPAQSLQQSVQKHRDQAVYYRFMADHVVPDSVYRLDESHLTRLGVKSERFY